MPLDDQEIDLVRASFHRLGPDLTSAGDSFYRHLFRIAPGTEQMFVSNMDEMAAKLMSTLGIVVSQLHNWADLEPVVGDLALRHVAYGVRPEHYAEVGAALDAMLAELLAEHYDPPTREAWLAAYDGISSAMIDIAYRETPAQL